MSEEDNKIEKEKAPYVPIKFDSEKVQLELLPPDALVVIGQVFTHGAKKYRPRNWEYGIDWGRYIGALMRHLMLFMAGENYDPDSGLPILAHLSCDALFLLSSQLRGIGVDNRWKLDQDFLDNLRKAVDHFETSWKTK